MLMNSPAARAMTARSSALRARSWPSSQALRCARAAPASSSPSAVALDGPAATVQRPQRLAAHRLGRD
jgi:hypothetical protein